MGAYVEAAGDEFNYANHWKEVIADNGPASTGLSADTQEATLTGYIPWNTQRSAARYFLGHAYSETTAPYFLHRENPHRHPIWPQLYAVSIAFSPVIVRANTDNANNSPYDESPFAVNQFSARYVHALATVTYRSFRHVFLEDDDMGGDNQNEWQRNAYFDVQPKVEALSCDGAGQLTFAEIGAGGNPPAGTKFPAAVAQLMAKTTFALVWSNVPWEHLSAFTTIFYPRKIMDCVGRVNNAAMFGAIFPAGTILMQAPQFNLKSSYIASDGLPFPVRMVDVTLNFEFFNPDKGVPGSSYRGHRLMPWRGATGDPLGGKWFLATRGGANTDPTMLQETDLMTCFENVNE